TLALDFFGFGDVKPHRPGRLCRPSFARTGGAAVKVARVASGGTGAPALAAPEPVPAGRPPWTPPAAPAAAAGRRGRDGPGGRRRGRPGRGWRRSARARPPARHAWPRPPRGSAPPPARG